MPVAAPCSMSVRVLFSRKEGDHGGNVYFEWDYSNQNKNWSGTSKAPAANDADKNILTNWLVVGANYTINRDWGVGVRIPTASRSFLTDTNFPDAPADLQSIPSPPSATSN